MKKNIKSLLMFVSCFLISTNIVAMRTTGLIIEYGDSLGYYKFASEWIFSYKIIQKENGKHLYVSDGTVLVDSTGNLVYLKNMSQEQIEAFSNGKSPGIRAIKGNSDELTTTAGNDVEITGEQILEFLQIKKTGEFQEKNAVS